MIDKLIKLLQEEYDVNKADYDIAGDVDDMIYYLGRMSFYKCMQASLKGIKNTDLTLKDYMEGFQEASAEIFAEYNTMNINTDTKIK